MPDLKRLAEFRIALTAAYAKADSAVTATWRARRDALHLAASADLLAGSISNEGLRTAIQATTAKIQKDAMHAENEAANRRSEISELLELLGGGKR